MKYFTFCDDLTNNAHILIAGATGSGKSVLLNDILYSFCAMSHKFPKGLNTILIDPKRVELSKWAKTPYCKGYAENTTEIIQILDKAICDIENRYKDMKRRGLVKYDGETNYIIIDELADLMITCKKDFLPRVQRIAQIGRAAGYHLICATQSPSRVTIPAALTLNFDCRIALRCQSAIESRQIIGEPGAEILPRYGQAIINDCGYLRQIDVPFLSADETAERIATVTTDEPKKEPPRKPKTFAEILESIRYYANRR